MFQVLRAAPAGDTHHCWSPPFPLGLVDFLVDGIVGQQFGVGAHGVEPAVVQNDDEVGALHRADALGDDEFGHIGELGQGVADARLGGGIHGAGGVIEDQHLGVLEEGPGDAEALLLAARYIDAALAQVGIQALGHAVQELVGPGSPAGGQDLLVGGSRALRPHFRLSRMVPEKSRFFCSTIPTASRKAARS